MKRDFSLVLKDIEGNPLLATPERHLTLGEACANALLNTYQEDAQVSGEEKMRRYELARKVYNKRPMSVTSEQIVLLKTYVAKLYGPVVVGPVFSALENNIAGALLEYDDRNVPKQLCDPLPLKPD